MPIEGDGTFSKRSSQEILADLIEALRDQFGKDADVTSTGTMRKFLEASLMLPLTETENVMDDLYRQMFPTTAKGENLDKHLEFIGSERKTASKSEGDVEIDFKTVQTDDPVFSSGSLTFQDTSGREYDLVNSVEKPPKRFDFNPSTATDSESINGTTTRIAQKFTLDDERYIQAFGALINHGGTSPTFTVRIENHDSTNDQPDGTLADTNLELTGWEPNDGTFTHDVFTNGAYIPEDTYWLVFERTAGNGTFEGGTSGTADQVKIYDGTWSLSSNVENLDAEVINGGIADVVATFFGENGNIEAGSINDVTFNVSSASSTWNENVQAFDNHNAFEGGQRREPDRAYRSRVRREQASTPESSNPGLQTAVLDVDGVSDVDIIENTTDTGGTENTPFDFDAGGSPVQSETIGSSQTYTRIAQAFTPGDRRFIQHFNCTVTHGASAPTFKVRIETDNSGAPSGTLAHSNLELTGFSPNDGTLSDATFNKGGYLDAGTTYWIVFEETGGGDGTFKGDDASGDNNVEIYDGSWGSSTNVDNLELEVVGGVPPHGFRLFVDGGVDNDIANMIYDSRAAGIEDDGATATTITNRAGQSVDVHFERPTKKSVFIDIAIDKNPDSFTGDADEIRDIIIQYVGGEDTDGTFFGGLGLNDDLIRHEVISRVLDDDNIIGTIDVTNLELGFSDNPTGTSNLSPGTGEILEITNPTDIDVTLNDV